MKKPFKHIVFISIPFLVVLVIFEIAVRLFHLPVLENEAYFDGFPGTNRYFLKTTTQNGTLYKTNPEKFIHPTEFLFTKTDSTFRVFCLGGSAVWGEPYGPTASLPHFLEQNLKNQLPDHKTEVINCGRKGFGSFRVKNIFDEVKHYNPNLIVIYFGNNEIRDYTFHRMEIQIQSRPILRIIKKILDNSYIFRLVYFDLFKPKVNSYGARQLGQLINQDQFTSKTFESHIQKINDLRHSLDFNFGGHHKSKLDSTFVVHGGKLDSLSQSLNRLNIWPENLERFFHQNVEHIIHQAQKHDIPILFVTRSRNLYYNKDARLLYEKYDSASQVVKKLCVETNTPCILSSKLFKAFSDKEIGYQYFVDSIHLTALANQILAKGVISEIKDWPTMPKFQNIETIIDQTPISYPPDVETELLALQAWQEWLLLPASQNQSQAVQNIIDLANKALELDSKNEKAYFLLGGLYTKLGKHEKAAEILDDIKKEFSLNEFKL